jgi:hypothetical protein
MSALRVKRTLGFKDVMSAYDPLLLWGDVSMLAASGKLNTKSRFRKIFSILPFLNLAISEMQETSHWLTHRWNVISEQRKSNWQHPNSYYREREETEHSATDERDTSRHPHPFRTLPTKAFQITADPGRNVILETLHFLVEIGNLRHRFVPMAARRSDHPGISTLRHPRLASLDVCFWHKADMPISLSNVCF